MAWGKIRNRSLTDLDAEIIKGQLPYLQVFHNDIIEDMWADFSDSWYSAGFLDVNDYYMDKFKRYLFTDDTY